MDWYRNWTLGEASAHLLRVAWKVGLPESFECTEDEIERWSAECNALTRFPSEHRLTRLLGVPLVVVDEWGNAP